MIEYILEDTHAFVDNHCTCTLINTVCPDNKTLFVKMCYVYISLSDVDTGQYLLSVVCCVISVYTSLNILIA